MKFSTANVVEADLPTVTDVVATAITDPGQGNPGGEWISATWPRIHSPAGRAVGLVRMTRLLNMLPEGSFVKVVDTDANDAIVGVAIWSTFLETPTKLPPLVLPEDFWLDSDEKEYGEHMKNETNIEFLRHYQAMGSPLLALEIFTIHPAYKRRGAGSVLLTEGLDRAEKLGASVFVNATVPGEKLYERFGFRMAPGNPYTIPHRDRWASKPQAGLRCMIRPRLN